MTNTTMINPTNVNINPTTNGEAKKDFAAELRGNVIGIRLGVHTFGKSRRMDSIHNAEIAEHFDAEAKAVNGTKKLFRRGCKEIRAIGKVTRKFKSLWRDMGISYTEPGVRLIRKKNLNNFVEEFGKLEAELREAVAEADANYDSILADAKESLGEKLFCRADYPEKLSDVVEVEWSVFNFEPNEELLKLAPRTYARELARVRATFDETVSIYEREVKAEMAKLVESLVEKLSPTAEGEKKVFREATTTNLRDFFDRFTEMGVFSDKDLTELVGKARDALGGVTMAELKKDVTKRDDLREKFGEIKGTLDSLLVDAPSRSIDLSDLDD